MNNQKRKQLNKAIELLNQAKDVVESVMDEEQEGFDNLNEGLKQAIGGQAMEEAIGNMGLAMECIDEAIDIIEEASI